MREFLEDALKHTEDGLGRAQKSDRQLPKRFYEEVSVVEVEGGHTVTLDGRHIKTPTHKDVVVSSLPLAEMMAAEWEEQEEFIDPDTMPHVKLVNSGVEGGAEAREALIAEVLKFCGNDLLLYRADSPRELVAKQDEVWDDALVRLARHFGVTFEPTVGILHKAQSPETLEKLASSLADLDHMRATAMVSITGILGSGLLAIALKEGLLDPDAAWAAAHVDEDYQIAQWGEDFEASARRERRYTEFDAAVNVLTWLAD